MGDQDELTAQMIETVETEILETDEQFNKFQQVAEAINQGMEQVALENYETSKEMPVFYGEYDGETVGEMMNEFYSVTEILPTDENGFVDGTFVFNVTFIPNKD